MSGPTSDSPSPRGTQTPTGSDDCSFLVDRLQSLEHKRPKIFRWKWILWTGALVVVAIGLWFALPNRKHEVQGFIELREKSSFSSAEEYEGYLKNQLFLLKSREVLTRTVNDPAVSDLEMIKRSKDPVRFLEENIFVLSVTPTIFAVSMKAAKTDEIKIIVDTLMKCYVDHATTTDRRERTEELQKLEKLESEFQEQIDSTIREMISVARDQAYSVSDKAINPSSQRIRELDRRSSQLREASDRVGDKIAHIKALNLFGNPRIRESARESYVER
jgi:hypothetical protein